MKLLLVKSTSNARTNWAIAHKWEHEVDIKVEKAIPYGINSTKEQEICDQLKKSNKKINWQINLKLEFQPAESVELQEVNRMEYDFSNLYTSIVAGRNYKVTIKLTTCISSESGNDAIFLLEMFRTDYPGTTFALDFEPVDSFTKLLSTGEMQLRENVSLSCQHEVVISHDVANRILRNMMEGVWDDNNWEMSVRVANPVVTKVSNTFSANKRILDEELSTDTIIKAGNGAEVKCLKGFLMAQSDVLKAMFQSGTEESKTGVVDMSDMSEEGVRAFLKYLYYNGVADAQDNIEIAWELLCAAEKYNVAGLEEDMMRLVTIKEENAFSVELALKILLFIKDKKNPDAEELKQKQIQFLKKNLEKLRGSAAYQELLKKNAAAVDGLIIYLLELAPDRKGQNSNYKRDYCANQKHY